MDQPVDARFEDRGILARGGMGMVRRVYDRMLEREVAVKTIARPESSDAAAQFMAEAQILAQLEHPGIVPVYDVRRDAVTGEVQLVMKLVAGRTLAAMLDELTTPPTGELLARLLGILVKVCEAVEYAHDRAVIHRDITPRNIMVGAFGEVYLMDWGMAVRRAADGSIVRLTGAPVPRVSPKRIDFIGSGTPSYMAPEQVVSAFDRIDQRTDVFGLGAVLYHVLTLRPPYASPNAFVLLADARKGSVRPPAEVVPEVLLPPRLCEIAMRALSADPAARHESVRALRADLEAFERGGGWFSTARFPRGTMVIRQGEPGEVAYILTAGTCEVFRMAGNERKVLRVVGPGSVIGEVALVTRSARTAFVEATDDVTALVVTRRELEQEFARAAWLRVFVDAAVQKFAALDQEQMTAR